MYIRFRLVFFSCLLLASVAYNDTNCPAGSLGMRPLDPFLFAGVPDQLCCVILGPDVHWRLEDLVFACPDATPVKANISSKTSDKICAYVNASRSGFCKCQLENQTCQANQYLNVDEPVPSKLHIECLNNWGAFIICMIWLPAFKFEENVSTSITWHNQRMMANDKTKVCSSYNKCELRFGDDPSIGHVLSFPDLLLNITVTVEYHIPDESNRVVTVASDVIRFKPQASAILKPTVGGKVDLAAATSLTIGWKRQQYFQDKKIVKIEYTAKEPRKYYDPIEVLEKENLTLPPAPDPSAMLSDLSPYTTYNICLTSRPEESHYWNDPKCFEGKTLADVPERSPKIFPDAFAAVDSSSVMLYWQKLEDWEWNDDLSDRRFILQKYKHPPHVSEEKFIDWRDDQTRVDVSKFSYFVLIAENSVGRTKNKSDFTVTHRRDRIPGPKNLKAVYSRLKGAVEISWQQAETNVIPFVYWCQQGDQLYSCRNSIERRTLNMGTTSFSVGANFDEIRGTMYGLSLCNNVGQNDLCSGISWQRCITILANENSTSLQGNCKTTKTVENSKLPSYAVVLLATIAIVIVAVIIVVVCRHIRKRLQFLKRQYEVVDIEASLLSRTLLTPPGAPPPGTPGLTNSNFHEFSGTSVEMTDSGNQSEGDTYSFDLPREDSGECNVDQVKLGQLNRVEDAIQVKEVDHNDASVSEGVNKDGTKGNHGVGRIDEGEEENRNDNNSEEEDDDDDEEEEEEEEEDGEEEEEEGSMEEEDTEDDNSNYPAKDGRRFVLRPKTEKPPENLYVHAVAEDGAGKTTEGESSTLTNDSSTKCSDIKTDEKHIVSNSDIPAQHKLIE